MGNLFKSEQVLQRQNTPEIEDDEAASGVAKVHGKEDKRSCGCCHEARTCVTATTPCGVCGGIPIGKS
jgi:hypothetical protein